MRLPLLFCTMVAATAFAVAPAEYAKLELVYRIDAASRVTEMRRGEIRFATTSLPPELHGLLVPRLNAAGQATLRELAVVHADGTTQSVNAASLQLLPGYLSWKVPELVAGDRLRFAVDQGVDVAGQVPNGWWVEGAAALPLPAASLTVELHAGTNAVTVLDTKAHSIADGAHTWHREHAQAASGAPLFIVGAFSKVEDAGAWLATRCPVTAATSSPLPANNAEDVTLRLAQQIAIDANAPVGLSCRAPGKVLAGGFGNQLEVQRELTARFRAAHWSAERLLLAPTVVRPTPASFTAAWLHVSSGAESYWIDVAHMTLSAPDLSAGRLFSLDKMRWFDWNDVFAPSVVKARLDLSLGADGTLQGALALNATGPASRVYRNSFLPHGGQETIVSMFAPFTASRRLRAGVVASDPYASGKPFALSIPLYEGDFITPIARRATLAPAVLRTALVGETAEPGRIWIGYPGVYAEEIWVDAPAFRTDAARPVDDKRSFARFHSSSEIVDGKLHLVRELTILQPFVDAATRPEVVEFNTVIGADQAHNFAFWRTAPVRVAEWVETVQPYQAQHLGLEAYNNRDYAAARLLLERAVKFNPKDQYAWNNLGRANAALGLYEEARKAYEKQIEVNPKDQYAYNNLGIVELNLGRFAEARDRFRKQLEIHPGDPYATRNLPRVLPRLGAWDEAERAYGAAKAANPNNTTYDAEIAVVRVCAVKPNAVEALRQLVKAQQSPVLKNSMAYQLAECGQSLDLAAQWALDAVRFVAHAMPAQPKRLADAFGVQSNLGAYLDTLAWVYRKQNSLERALPLLESAAGMHRSGEVLAHLGEVQWHLGRRDDALMNWRDALAIMPGLTASVPVEAHALLTQKPPHGDWAELGTIDAANSGHCAALADSSGHLRQLRCLDLPAATTRAIEPQIARFTFPVVNAPDGAVASVHVLRLEPTSTGTTRVTRSVADNAIRLLVELAPEEFLPPEPSAPRK